MGINFTLKDSVVEDSEILTRVNGPMEDANIMICDVKLTRSKLFTDLNIPKFCDTIQNQNMDSAEKASMQNILEKKADRKAFMAFFFMVIFLPPCNGMKYGGSIVCHAKKMSRELDYTGHKIFQSVFIHEDMAIVEWDLDRL